MNANEIITILFTDNLIHRTTRVHIAEREYIPVLEWVESLPATIQDDALGLGVYLVDAHEPNDTSACCDSCGKEHTPCWRVDDSAGWLCLECLIEQAIAEAEEEQAFISAEQNATSDPNWPENDPYQMLP